MGVTYPFMGLAVLKEEGAPVLYDAKGKDLMNLSREHYWMADLLDGEDAWGS